MSFELEVRVDLREVAGRACFRYETRGLAPRRKELALSVAQKGELDPPEDPIRFLEQSHLGLLDQAPLEPLRVERLEPRMLGFEGVGVVRGSGGSLELVLLRPLELVLAQQQGLGRVLAALGHFPAPPYADRERKDIRGLGGAPLEIGAGAFPGVFVTVDGETVTLTVLESARERIQARLDRAPPSAPVSFVAEADPRASAWLGKGTGARASASFVVFAPGRLADEVELVEDGVSLALTGASWSAIRTALLEGNDLELALGERKLVLDWNDAFADVSGVAEPAGEIRVARTLLLASDDQIAERVGQDTLHAFARVALEAARASLPLELAHGIKMKGKLRPPARCEWVVFRPAGSRPGQLDRLLAALGALPAPSSRGEVTFELQLEVS